MPAMTREQHVNQLQAAAAKQAKAKKRRRVGFYGCVGGVFRVEDKSFTYPRTPRVDCPGCGHNHTVHLAWRPYKQALDLNKKAIQLS
jgi:hypothetical protein